MANLMENIIGEGYEALYQSEGSVVVIKGTLRLNGVSEYQGITDMLNGASDAVSELVLDLRELQFLNSSGIATFSKFVLHARAKENFSLKILGSKAISWQSKSLVNLGRLMPSLILEIE